MKTRKNGFFARMPLLAAFWLFHKFGLWGQNPEVVKMRARSARARFRVFHETHALARVAGPGPA